MPVDLPPPLRIREADGSPNAIPVFEIIVSNGTLTKVRPGVVALATGTGGQGPAGPSGGMAIGSSVVLSVTGAVLFVDSSNNLGQNPANLFWDNPNLRLGIGTSTPGITFDVIGSGRFSSIVIGAQATSAGHLVRADRLLNTTAPLAGGGNLTADRTLTADTAALVTSGRQITTVFPTSGGGDLSADRIIYVTTGGFLVLSSRAINTTAPLAGGGNLGADRTFTLDTAAIVTSGRSISTLFPLSGGGDLSANRTFVADTAFLVTSARAITAGSGLSGGGDFSADRTLSVNTNVRDKATTFFFAGALATTSLAVNSRVYIPFNMQLLQVRLASQTAPTGESIIINPLQYNATLAASTAIFAATNRPMIVGGVNVGSDNATIGITSLFTGSWLGVNLDAVGTTNAGSSMTVTFITRAS